MKFLCDDMLGKLARWLRILGYDVEYCPEVPDGELIHRALYGRRVLLTRDRGLVQRKSVRSFLLVRAERLEEQLREVVGAFRLSVDLERIFSRCVVCNSPTEPIPKEEARGRVPPFVWETQEEFTQCPDCGKIYWKATHYARARARLKKIFSFP